MKRRDAIFVEVAHGQHQPKVPSRVCIVRARRLLLRVEAAQHLPDVKLGVLSIPTRDRQARSAWHNKEDGKENVSAREINT